MAEGFFFGRIDEGAGVNDDHISLFRFGNNYHPSLVQMPDHDLAIHEIFGATERDEADFDHILGGELVSRSSGGGGERMATACRKSGREE